MFWFSPCLLCRPRTVPRISLLTSCILPLTVNLTLRCYIWARQLVLCARILCNELKRQSQRSARLRADHRALQPTSTPSVHLAVIRPNHRSLFVQLSLAWNKRTSARATNTAYRTRCDRWRKRFKKTRSQLPMRFARKGADVTRVITASGPAANAREH